MQSHVEMYVHRRETVESSVEQRNFDLELAIGYIFSHKTHSFSFLYMLGHLCLYVLLDVVILFSWNNDSWDE